MAPKGRDARGGAGKAKAGRGPTLSEEQRRLKELAAWADPSYAPQRVDRLAHLSDGSCVVLSHEPRLYLFENGSLTSLGMAPEWIARGPSASRTAGLLALEDDEFKVIGLDRASKGKPRAKVAKKVGKFPKAWNPDEEEDENIWDACLSVDGELHLAALVQDEKPKPCFLVDSSKGEGDDDDLDGPDGDDSGSEGSSEDDDDRAPTVYPAPPRWRTLMALHGGRKVKVCRVPFQATLLSLSPDGQACAYQVPVGEIQEEANRGEWYVCRLAKGAAPRQVSRGPLGRVAEVPARFSPSGEQLVYQANHSAGRPITQHMDLWLVDLRDDSAQPTKLTPGSLQVDAFDWAGDSKDSLWLSATAGCKLRSFLLRVQTKALEPVEPPAAYSCLPSWSPRTGACCYPVESADAFEGLWDGAAGRLAPLPEWSAHFEDMRCEAIEWTGPDGATVSGALYFSDKATGDRPLLVWAHGGPTCSWPILRGNFSNDARLGEPSSAALLRAGYLVLVPLFRGTLGFGDEWSMATIGRQGGHDGDLGDILMGVAHLQRTRMHGCSPSAAGIFGESYGGYLTIKALSDPEGAKVFGCGVSLYGYINNREATLLIGDPTWEDEFIGPSTEWPPPKRVEDCHDDLGNIRGPLLLLHGSDDEACPVSHSQLVYAALRQRAVPTELAIYPGQGHGFEGEKVQRDANCRILQWFLRHLPPGALDSI